MSADLEQYASHLDAQADEVCTRAEVTVPLSSLASELDSLARRGWVVTSLVYPASFVAFGAAIHGDHVMILAVRKQNMN